MVHQFKNSLRREQEFIKQKKYIPALRCLNIILREKFNWNLDCKTYVDYSFDKEKQKQGIDAGCDLVCLKTNIREFFTWDYKIRFKPFDDFLAETISVDSNNTPGWAVDPNKKNKLIININAVTKQVIVLSRKELKDAIDSGKFSDIKVQKSNNGYYNTKFIAISLDRLKEECPKTIDYYYD